MLDRTEMSFRDFIWIYLHGLLHLCKEMLMWVNYKTDDLLTHPTVYSFGSRYICKFVPTNLYHSPQHMLPTKTSTTPNTVLIILILLKLHCKLSLLSETTVAPITLQYSLLLDALALHSPLSCRSAFQLLNIGTRRFDTRIFLQPIAELLVWHSHNPKNSCSDCSSTAITCTSRYTHMSTHRRG
jgi:hypothetical protein